MWKNMAMTLLLEKLGIKPKYKYQKNLKSKCIHSKFALGDRYSVEV